MKFPDTLPLADGSDPPPTAFKWNVRLLYPLLTHLPEPLRGWALRHGLPKVWVR